MTATVESPAAPAPRPETQPAVPHAYERNPPADVVYSYAAAEIRQALLVIRTPEQYRPHDRYGMGGGAWAADGETVPPWHERAAVFTPFGALGRACVDLGHERLVELRPGSGDGVYLRHPTPIHMPVSEAIWRAVADVVGHKTTNRIGGRFDGLQHSECVALLVKAGQLLDERAAEARARIEAAHKPAAA
jgi:hypothetical protein